MLNYKVVTHNKLYKWQNMLNYTMKQKLSVSLDENLLKSIDELVDTGKFRNKSHLVEYSVNAIVKQESEKTGGKEDE